MPVARANPTVGFDAAQIGPALNALASATGNIATTLRKPAAGGAQSQPQSQPSLTSRVNPSPIDKASSWIRANPWPTAGIGALVVLIVVGLVKRK